MIMIYLAYVEKRFPFGAPPVQIINMLLAYLTPLEGAGDRFFCGGGLGLLALV